jgi:hypothetical protein
MKIKNNISVVGGQRVKVCVYLFIAGLISEEEELSL